MNEPTLSSIALNALIEIDNLEALFGKPLSILEKVAIFERKAEHLRIRIAALELANDGKFIRWRDRMQNDRCAHDFHD